MSINERDGSFSEGQDPRLRTGFEIAAARTIFKKNLDAWEDSADALGISKEPSDPTNDRLWISTPEPVRAAVSAVKGLARSNGLRYSMGERPTYFEDFSELVDEEIFSGNLDLSSAVDLSATTRPLPEVSLATKIINSQVNTDVLSELMVYVKDREREGRNYIAPDKVATLWKAQTTKGGFEALDYVLGADNEIAKIVKDYKNS